MKKLIKEIETRANESATREGVHSSPFEEGVAVGLNIALQIVKSHDPWIDISEELPHPYEQESDRSIEILILTEDGNIYTGVYVYEQKAFFILNRRSIAKEIKWTYLPEVKR